LSASPQEGASSALRLDGGVDELQGYRWLPLRYGNTQVVVPQLLGSWSQLMLFCFNVLFAVDFYFFKRHFSSAC
jgi:hypothetical protein